MRFSANPELVNFIQDIKVTGAADRSVIELKKQFLEQQRRDKGITYAYLVRNLYLSIVSHNANKNEFIKATGYSDVGMKVIGYLGCMNSMGDLDYLMLVNSLKKDLRVERTEAIALTYICNMFNRCEYFSEFLDAVSELQLSKRRTVYLLKAAWLVSKLCLRDSADIFIKIQSNLDIYALGLDNTDVWIENETMWIENYLKDGNLCILEKFKGYSYCLKAFSSGLTTFSDSFILHLIDQASYYGSMKYTSIHVALLSLIIEFLVMLGHTKHVTPIMFNFLKSDNYARIRGYELSLKYGIYTEFFIESYIAKTSYNAYDLRVLRIIYDSSYGDYYHDQFMAKLNFFGLSKSNGWSHIIDVTLELSPSNRIIEILQSNSYSVELLPAITRLDEIKLREIYVKLDTEVCNPEITVFCIAILEKLPHLDDRVDYAKFIPRILATPTLSSYPNVYAICLNYMKNRFEQLEALDALVCAYMEIRRCDPHCDVLKKIRYSLRTKYFCGEFTAKFIKRKDIVLLKMAMKDEVLIKIYPTPVNIYTNRDSLIQTRVYKGIEVAVLRRPSDSEIISVVGSEGIIKLDSTFSSKKG